VTGTKFNDQDSKGYEDIKDRMGFSAERYLKHKGYSVVGVTYMKVAPDMQSAVENLAAGADALKNKAMGQ
jgi:hypothetical protein